MARSKNEKKVVWCHTPSWLCGELVGWAVHCLENCPLAQPRAALGLAQAPGHATTGRGVYSFLEGKTRPYDHTSRPRACSPILFARTAVVRPAGRQGQRGKPDFRWSWWQLGILTIGAYVDRLARTQCHFTQFYYMIWICFSVQRNASEFNDILVVETGHLFLDLEYRKSWHLAKRLCFDMLWILDYQHWTNGVKVQSNINL